MDDLSYSLFPEPPVSGSSQINVGPTERVISALGGAALTTMAFRQHQPVLGALMGGLGVALLYRGLSGHCPLSSSAGRGNERAQRVRPISAHASVKIAVPREDVYNYWRELSNLPRFMPHILKVEELDARTSHWTARFPGSMGKTSWDAEIHQDEPNERIVWRSVPGAMVDNAGEVQFIDVPGDMGTQVHVHISYRPPAGEIGLRIARALNHSFEATLQHDLECLKATLEDEVVPVGESEAVFVES